MFQKQSDHLWEVREALGQLNRKQLSALLEANNQQLPTEEHKVYCNWEEITEFYDSLEQK